MLLSRSVLHAGLALPKSYACSRTPTVCDRSRRVVMQECSYYWYLFDRIEPTSIGQDMHNGVQVPWVV
jgi:hypothetical protein